MNDNTNITTKKPQAHKICTVAFLLASIITAVLAFTLSYNTKTGYLNSSFSAKLLTVIVVAELIAAAVVTLKSNPATTTPCTSKASNIITLILHAAVTYCGAMAIVRENAMIFPLGNNAVTAIKAIFSIAIILAFLTNSAICKRKEELSVAEIINGCSTVVFCLCAITLLYFDLSVEMNNPSKLYLQFSAAAVCLTSLCSLKVRFHDKGARLANLFRLATIALAPVATISTIIACFAGEKSFSPLYLFLSIIVGAYLIAYALSSILYKEV